MGFEVGATAVPAVASREGWVPSHPDFQPAPIVLVILIIIILGSDLVGSITSKSTIKSMSRRLFRLWTLDAWL